MTISLVVPVSLPNKKNLLSVVCFQGFERYFYLCFLSSFFIGQRRQGS